MKIPLLFVSCIVVSVFGTSLFAQQGENTAPVPAANEVKGGFVGRGYAFGRIGDVQLLPDGSVILVSGRIIGRIKDNMYLLEEPDRSITADNRIEGGRIAAEIGDDLWQGQVVETGDWVSVIGEVKRSDGVATLKAKQITKIEGTRQREQRSADWMEERRNRLNEMIEKRRQEQETRENTPVEQIETRASRRNEQAEESARRRQAVREQRLNEQKRNILQEQQRSFSWPH